MNIYTGATQHTSNKLPIFIVSWWVPITGGGNVPEMNNLLRNFNISLGERLFDAKIVIDGLGFAYASGSHITSFPKGGNIMKMKMADRSKVL